MTRRLALLLLAVSLPLSALAADVGDQRTFWGWDLSEMPPADRQFTATCRAVGEYGYIWVEDAVWDDQMDADDVEAIRVVWDESVPADDEAGIFEVVSGIFGDPPDVFDDDPRIHLVYYDIGSFQQYTFDGFFRADDEGDGPTSNRVEMLHLNSANDPAGDGMLAVAAHELTHLIFYNYDPDEEGWVQESLAEAAMIACGYYTDEGWVEDFADEPETALIPPDAYSLHYGAALLFGTYLLDRFGEDFLGDLVAEPGRGIDGIEALLADSGGPPAFADLFGQWTAANFADWDGHAPYDFTSIAPPPFHSSFGVAGEANRFEVPAWGTVYLRFPVQAGDTYDVTVASDSLADLRVHAVSMDGELDRALSVHAIDGGRDRWPIEEDGFAVVGIAHAAGGGSVSGTVTLTPAAADDDGDDDDTPGDDDSEDGDSGGGADDGSGCG